VAGEPTLTEFEAGLTDRQRELIERLADWIVQRRMSTVAILFLESVRPMNFVGSQIMVIFQPAVQAVFKMPEWDELRLVLEQRESVGHFIDLIEKKEGDMLVDEAIAKEKAKIAKAEAKKQRKEERLKKKNGAING